MKASQGKPAVAKGKGLPVGWKDFLLLHLTLLLYAVVSVFAKNAAFSLAAGDRVGLFLWGGLELFTLLGYTVLWQQTLGRMPLNFAYSNKAVCTLWTCLFGVIFFGETITLGKGIGLLVVLLGVWLVVTGDE